MLYKKNGAVSGVGSDFLSDWALYTASPRPIVVRFARNKKENLSWLNPGNKFYIKVVEVVHFEKWT